MNSGTILRETPKFPLNNLKNSFKKKNKCLTNTLYRTCSVAFSVPPKRKLFTNLQGVGVGLGLGLGLGVGLGVFNFLLTD